MILSEPTKQGVSEYGSSTPSTHHSTAVHDNEEVVSRLSLLDNDGTVVYWHSLQSIRHRKPLPLVKALCKTKEYDF